MKRYLPIYPIEIITFIWIVCTGFFISVISFVGARNDASPFVADEGNHFVWFCGCNVAAPFNRMAISDLFQAIGTHPSDYVLVSRNILL